MQTIKYNCPNCGHGLSIPVQYAGRQGGCKHCGKNFTVPQVGPPPPLPSSPQVGTTQKAFGVTFGGCMGLSAAFAAIPLVLIGGCIVSAVVIGGAGSALGPAPSTTQAVPAALPLPEPAIQIPAEKEEPVVTLAEFNQLFDGMTYQQAVGIIGAEGKVISTSNIAGYSTVMYSWENPGFFNGNMNAMFQNNAMVIKAQLGLR